MVKNRLTRTRTPAELAHGTKQRSVGARLAACRARIGLSIRARPAIRRVACIVGSVVIVIVVMLVRYVHPLLNRRECIWLLDQRRLAQVLQLLYRVPTACHLRRGLRAWRWEAGAAKSWAIFVGGVARAAPQGICSVSRRGSGSSRGYRRCETAAHGVQCARVWAILCVQGEGIKTVLR